MRLDFQTNIRTGRFYLRVNDGAPFETYHLDDIERIKLREMIEHIRDQAFREGQTCQQVRESIDVSGSSKGSTEREAPPPFVRIQHVNPCERGVVDLSPVGASVGRYGEESDEP